MSSALMNYVFGIFVIILTTTDLLCSFLPYYSCGVSQINGNFKTKVCRGLLGNNINIKISDKEKLSSNFNYINDKATSEQVSENGITPIKEYIFTCFSILLYVCLFVINYVHCIKKTNCRMKYGKLMILTCIFALSLAKHLVGNKRIDILYDMHDEVNHGDTFYLYTAHLCNIFIIILYEVLVFFGCIAFRSNCPIRPSNRNTII
ncbi:uncharacterized protein LOC105843311 isoform X2 [Hydra vulgaris]|uniref:Uncharacterized protein LOC105843311 isoform X2 n=1 Tax=Hydra vulgaris TaxID=6087 RepID=A0ABM4CV00_HYDVU